MTSSHEALYRAICAHPDEDTPRLAFADLLDEDGDSLRARFIRTQVALARLPQYDDAWVKARQFEPDAATGWGMAHTLPRVPRGCSWQRFEFRRGFPWKVGVVSLGDFLSGGEAVFDSAPIQALDIDARHRPGLGMLADWPPLGRLHKLEFSNGWFSAADIARLAESEHTANLTEIGFEFDALALDGLTALASSPLFPRLEGLELRSIKCPPALLVDSLAEVREPGALARLSLPDNDFRRDDLEHLLALPVMSSLQHLDVSDNRLGVEGVTVLAESRVLRRLSILNLSRTKPGVPGVKALAELGNLGGLRMLDLSANSLGPVAVKALAQSWSLSGLRVLNLAGNLVGDAGAAALAASRSLAGLVELDLRDAGIGDAGAIALAESPHLDNLLRLDLRNRELRHLGSAARDALLKRFEDRVCL